MIENRVWTSRGGNPVVQLVTFNDSQRRMSKDFFPLTDNNCFKLLCLSSNGVCYAYYGVGTERMIVGEFKQLTLVDDGIHLPHITGELEMYGAWLTGREVAKHVKAKDVEISYKPCGTFDKRDGTTTVMEFMGYEYRL